MLLYVYAILKHFIVQHSAHVVSLSSSAGNDGTTCKAIALYILAVHARVRDLCAVRHGETKREELTLNMNVNTGSAAPPPQSANDTIRLTRSIH